MVTGTFWLGVLWLCVGVVACVVAFAGNRQAGRVPFIRACFVCLGIVSLLLGARDLHLLADAVTDPLTWVALVALLICFLAAWRAGEIRRPPAGGDKP